MDTYSRVSLNNNKKLHYGNNNNNNMSPSPDKKIEDNYNNSINFDKNFTFNIFKDAPHIQDTINTYYESNNAENKIEKLIKEFNKFDMNKNEEISMNTNINTEYNNSNNNNNETNINVNNQNINNMNNYNMINQNNIYNPQHQTQNLFKEKYNNNVNKNDE